MKVISRPIQGGKTSQAAEWLKEKPNERLLIVMSRDEKERIMRKYGLNFHQVETCRDMMDGYDHGLGKRYTEIMIDNVDLLIQKLFPFATVVGFTITTENKLCHKQSTA